MADIFIGYAREDRQHAARLAHALESQGWSVWWDVKIRAGRTFDEVIEEAIEGAKCVIVLWSGVSVKKRWVRTEAAEGVARDILVPVLIEKDVSIPLAFRRIHAANLVGWDGSDTAPSFRSLVGDVAAVLGPPPKVEEERHPEVEAEIEADPASRTAFRAGKTFRDGPDCPEMVVIPAGRFTMGSPGSEKGRYKDEGPQHRVDISHDFALGKYPVTRAEYAAFARATGREWPKPKVPWTERDPAVNVSWEDAKNYVVWLSERTGNEYRLPSEAEWEYAARAGTTTATYWGEDEAGAREYAQLEANPAPVGSLKPNAFGVYDMLGNVWEWVDDCWNMNYQGAPADGSPWTSGDCDKRVRRGGGVTRTVRAADRDKFGAAYLSSTTGFRVARNLP